MLFSVFIDFVCMDVSRVAASSWLLLLAIAFRGSLSQMEQCQSILQAIDSTPFDLTCEAFGNCTGLSCQLQTFIADNGSTSFAVIQKCEDPVRVMVEINIDAGSAEVQQQYEVTTEQQNRTINTAIGTVSFTISRNDTQMNFMAMSIYQGDIALLLIPDVSVPLNTTECSCQSLQDLAALVESPVEHDCNNNSRCDGVRCELDIFGEIFFVEVVVLSCAQPVAMEVLVEVREEDNTFRPLSTFIYDQDLEGVLVIEGVEINIDGTIIHNEYSIEVEAELVVPIFGRVRIIPRHTILLDRSMCSGPLTPPPPTITIPPPTISIPAPSSAASRTCVVLYETAVNATSEPFLCGLDDDCDELNCRLDILSTHYAIDVEVESCDSPPSVEVTVSDAGGRVLGRERAVDSRTFSVVIPEPNGTSVMVAVEERDSAVRLKVDLIVTWPQNRVSSLIPYTDIPYDCQESDDTQKIIAIAVPVGVVVLIAVVVVVLVGGAMCLRQRRQTEQQFDFKPMSSGKFEKTTNETNDTPPT